KSLMALLHFFYVVLPNNHGWYLFFVFQAEDGIRGGHVTGVQTCALPILCEKRGESMQTLVAYVENKPGVLNRVSSLARRLAINIDSLTVGPTENEEIARMTIVAHT